MRCLVTGVDLLVHNLGCKRGRELGQDPSLSILEAPGVDVGRPLGCPVDGRGVGMTDGAQSA